MGVYPLETLLRQWARGDLTAEQAIGQILQILSNLQDRVRDLENRLLRREQAERAEPPGS